MDETTRRRVEAEAPGPQEPLPRVLSLSECAERLGMKSSNVAKYLARHGVRPAFRKAQGYFWPEDAIERLREAREADSEKVAADERRREAALTGVSTQAPRVPRARLGAHQRDLLERMLRRPLEVVDEPTRYAILRLRRRGFVEPIEDGVRIYALTDAGREAVMNR